MPQCLPSTPSDQQLLFLLKLSQWRPSSLRGQMGEVFSDLPQQTSPSLFYNMRAPPRYWIDTATDMVEPRGPDSGQHVRIEGDFRGRSGSVVIEESRKETQHAGSAQILDCSSPTYLNRHCRAYSTTCGLRPDIGLLPQPTSSGLGGQIPSRTDTYDILQKKGEKRQQRQKQRQQQAPTAGEGAKESSEARKFRRWKTQR